MPLKVRWAPKVQRAMQPLPVVKDFDIIEQRSPGFSQAAKFPFTPIDELQFQGAPKSFHDGIVITICFPAHRGAGAHGFEGLPILAAGVLDSPIGVDD